MFCNKCGNQIAENESFCMKCGAPAQAVAVEAVQPVQSDTNVYAPVQATPAFAIKLYDILMFVALALMAIGTLVPCYEMSVFGETETFNYIQGDGVFVVAAAVIGLVLYFLRKDKFITIPAGIAAAIILVMVGQIAEFGGGRIVELSYGIGFYLMWIGIIAAIVLPFTPLSQHRKK